MYHLKKLTHKTFNQVHPLHTIEEHIMIMKDGRAALGFELQLYDMEKWNSDEYRSYNLRFTHALRELPTQTIIQRIDIYYFEPYKSDNKEAGYFSNKFNSHFFERPQLKHKAYLFFSLGHVKQPPTNPINTLFTLGKAAFPNPFEKIEERKMQVESIAESFIQSVGLKAYMLDEKTILSLLCQYFNLEFSTHSSQLRRQISPLENGMALGEKLVNVISMIGQGSNVDHAITYRQLDNPYIAPLTHYLHIPHILSSTIRIEDTQVEMKRLDTEGKIISSLNSLTGQAALIKQEELNEFTGDIRKNFRKLVSTNVSVIIWANNQKDLQRSLQGTVKAIQSINGARPFIENKDTTNLFFSSTPGNGAQQYRWLKMTAENASAYHHYTTLYKSDRKGILLSDRFGNPILLDLFSNHLNNKNGIVIGPSGSGKSFTVGSIILQRYEQGAKQIIIDVGGSYENVIAALSGKYMKYDVEAPFSFNPFLVPIVDQHYYVSDDKIIFLITLLATIWKKEAELSKEEEAVLSQLIPEYYQQLSIQEKPSLRSFYYWLKQIYPSAQNQESARTPVNLNHFDTSSFLLVLETFAIGKYSNVLNANDTVDISQYSLVAFDMAGVKDNPILYPVISLLITELAIDTIHLFPDLRKYLYMDEAWSMLSNTMGGFVERMYRTIRKNRGAIYIITQGISEITDSKVGAPIIANADIKIVLQHTDLNQLEKVGNTLGLTSHEIAKIHSIRKESKRREIFIKTGDYGRIYFLEVAKEIALLLSSTPEERDKLNAIKKRKNGNIQYALDEYLQSINN